MENKSPLAPPDQETCEIVVDENYISDQKSVNNIDPEASEGLISNELAVAQKNHHQSENTRVLVDHDVLLIRDSLESLLNFSGRLTVIKPHSPENGTRQKDGAVDIVLAISELASGTAVEHINRIKYTFPGAKVVIIGVSGTEKESLEYIEAGASGYVLPDTQLENLIEAIHTVRRGEALCPPAMMARIFERIASLKTQLQVVQNIGLSSLTQRELEVLQLVSDGMSNKEIANSLKLELQTVKNHIHRIIEKLQVRNRWEAVAYKRKYKIAVETSNELSISPPSAGPMAKVR